MTKPRLALRALLTDVEVLDFIRAAFVLRRNLAIGRMNGKSVAYANQDTVSAIEAFDAAARRIAEAGE